MSIKKKIGGALLGTALGAALIGGGTFALFTDTATNEGNSFATGNLSIKDITGGDGRAAFNVTNMAPGDTGNGTFKIENNGDYDVWVGIDSAEDTGGLADVLELTVPGGAVHIPKGEAREFTISYEMDLDAGNEYQNQTATVDVEFKAVQYKNNINVTNDGPKSWNEDAN
ncbi:TasA family protein [Bacillus sp. FJAT-27245]|uniref:TasA family protein n=1 Tax=Bacillus sp. FJAT-27245 TaxID=1684144 RepID=UPI0006A7B0FC|nr:TasA family protein [Bacillus sp. FJAT-27245]